MKKLIKKWGNNLVISFSKEEKELYNLRQGDYLDLSDAVTVKKKLKGGKRT